MLHGVGWTPDELDQPDFSRSWACPAVPEFALKVWRGPGDATDVGEGHRSDTLRVDLRRNGGVAVSLPMRVSFSWGGTSPEPDVSLHGVSAHRALTELVRLLAVDRTVPAKLREDLTQDLCGVLRHMCPPVTPPVLADMLGQLALPLRVLRESVFGVELIRPRNHTPSMLLLPAPNGHHLLIGEDGTALLNPELSNAVCRLIDTARQQALLDASAQHSVAALRQAASQLGA